eukprot:scpid67318/ scgid25076/ 
MAAATHCLHGILKRFGLDHFHVEYNVYFSNHLLHAVVALHKLGASEERLEQYAREISQQFEPTHPSEGQLSGDEWRSLLGKRERFPDLCQFFRQEVAQRGVSGAIGHYMPSLLNGGIACAAFHPIIHLGYALLGESDQDVGDGLAYVVFEHRSPASDAADHAIHQRTGCAMSTVEGKASTAVPQQAAVQFTRLDHALFNLLQKLRKDERLQKLLPILYERVDARGLDVLAAETGFGLFSNRLFIIQDNATELINGHMEESGLLASITTEERLDSLFRAVMQVAVGTYASTEVPDDFFLLHGVTSAYALHQVLPHLPSLADRVNAVAVFCRDLLTAFVLRDMPVLVGWTPDESDLPSWDEIKERATADEDEHLIKLVFTCSAMEQLLGKSWNGYQLYRAVAAYKSGLRQWPRGNMAHASVCSRAGS